MNRTTSNNVQEDQLAASFNAWIIKQATPWIVLIMDNPPSTFPNTGTARNIRKRMFYGNETINQQIPSCYQDRHVTWLVPTPLRVKFIGPGGAGWISIWFNFPVNFKLIPSKLLIDKLILIWLQFYNLSNEARTAIAESAEKNICMFFPILHFFLSIFFGQIFFWVNLVNSIMYVDVASKILYVCGPFSPVHVSLVGSRWASPFLTFTSCDMKPYCRDQKTKALLSLQQKKKFKKRERIDQKKKRREKEDKEKKMREWCKKR